VNVTVSNSGGLMAVYDSTLRAPKCAAVGISCDSGTLLNGRGTRGPEVNAPNTINSSCADGNSGTYHVDESNDRIKVLTVDGTPLAPGKTVRVEATVWAYSSYTSDKLDLYYAANANSPTWTLIGTYTPPGSGARVMSATYTLPAGSLQAVRARFRYQGSATPCGTGSYIDHDDLIFAVQ
jgi:leucyl aminopeptidase